MLNKIPHNIVFCLAFWFHTFLISLLTCSKLMHMNGWSLNAKDTQDLMLISQSSSHKWWVIGVRPWATIMHVNVTFVILCPLWCHASHPLGLIVVPSQCRAQRLPLTKIPTSTSRVAVSLDRHRPSSVEPQGSPVLQRFIAKVGEW